MERIPLWCQEHALSLPDTFAGKMETLKELLYLWNSRHNLTRIAPVDFESLHVLDSLACALFFEDPKDVKKVVDLGTGAGFPGIPLAAFFPEIQFTLVDKTRKRITFLEQVVATLGLTNVVLVHGRIEDLAIDPLYREAFPVVLSRALAPLKSLLPLAVPFCAKGGTLLFLKSITVFEEFEGVAPAERAEWGISNCRFEPYRLPGVSDCNYGAIFKRSLGV